MKVLLMKDYIGTKKVKAKPITRSEYLKYRGWDLPEGENPDDEVYLVEYEADPLSPPNHPDHEGYITMSPKHVFEKSYSPSGNYIDRLKIEFIDLDDKIVRLEDALHKGLAPATETDILDKQLLFMQSYREVLLERIATGS